jgi:predicted DNA-binding transcriptional regulator AlpA
MANHVGLRTPGQALPGTHITLPAELGEVALINATVAAAVGGMSVSWWHERVAAGEAPQPAVRGPRCTRWRAADVRQFWVDFAKRSADRAAVQVTAQATKASAAALAKRRTLQAEA